MANPMLRYLLMSALALGLGCDDGDEGPGAAADAALADALVSDQDVADQAVGSDAEPAEDAAAMDAAAVLDATPDAMVEADAAPPPTLSAAGPNERDVEFGWIAAGQPSEPRVREIVAAGVPIISLRYPEEDPFDEPGLIAGLGGTFTRYPTSGADYERVEFREGMYDLYDAAIAAGGTVYLHCASSNRVGASWALYHGERLGLDVEAAIEKGRGAGLRSLEALVRGILTP